MGFFIGLLNILWVLCSVFLICLVLIQRGKGGGLAGAFGGMGGSSAFGTKAGDVFTQITMYTAVVWIALGMGLVWLNNNRPATSAYNLSGSGSATGGARPTKSAGTKAKDRATPPPIPASSGPSAPIPVEKEPASDLPSAIPTEEPAPKKAP